MNAGGSDPTSRRDEAFTGLFDANWASVRHHVEGVVDDDALVTEIVSEVFLAAWSHLNPRRPLGRVWLLRAAERAVRSRGRRPTTPSTAAAVHEGIRGEQSAPAAEESAAVLRALSVLPERERRIIRLTYWDGLTIGEIAELSRISANRVRKTLHRAHERVRDALRSEGVIADD